ncbi:serine hydrolase [Alkalihalobacillus sp. AL-G]|uniref:serine hydrolase domain-containing protein n=1 Tax=Alkalihalobacillus sp. AL-G TaxID=2926399 RepID=UPI00272CE09F|nr:serine hydrolase domain-containing protein [Alkalihalobacillus sp. AL-G]WLD91730.1 beta-lactamase family protein [Alkalihalobacillus sp. AL-G]
MENKRWIDSFEGYVEKVINKYELPGAAIGFARDGVPLYEKGFGYRDVEKQLGVTSDTVFGIASVTKSFTCVAIMQLQEQGRLSVHDPIVKYLPEFQTPDKTRIPQITVHHLMTHTSGLPPLSSLVFAMKRSMESDTSVGDYPGLKWDKEKEEPIDTYEELMEFIANSEFELLGKPGTEFSYSNDGYALLGAIIERVSGKSYEMYIKEQILQPAGMDNSTFDLDDLEGYHDITNLYATKNEDGKKEVYAAPIWWDAPSMRAAGFLKSTVRDMLKYAGIFQNAGVVGKARILSVESVKQMTEPYVECEPGRYYGYGLMITPDFHGVKLVEHGGSLKAISSQLVMVPEKGLSGIILTNLAGVPAYKLALSALNCIQGLPVDSTHNTFKDYEIAEKHLPQYTGQYTTNEGAQIVIGLEEGKLTFTTLDESYPIRAVGESLFVVDLKDSEAPLRMLYDDEGEVKGITFGFRQLLKVKEEKVKEEVTK